MPNIVIEALPHYPKEFEPYETQYLQWQDIVPNVEPQENFILVIPTGENSIEELKLKGVNRFRRGDIYEQSLENGLDYLSQGIGYDEVPTTQVQFSLPDRGVGASEWVSPPGYPITWPNIWNRRFFNTPDGATEPMTYSEGVSKGHQTGTAYTLVIWENSEQDHAISWHWPFVKGWSQAWHDRLESKWNGSGKKLLTAWNYFTGISVPSGSSAQKKDILRAPLNTWPSNPMLPGGNLERFNAYCIPMYWNSPELGYESPYVIAYHYYVAKKTGKKPILFSPHTLESNPSGLKEVRQPAGKYYHKEKLTIEPNFTLTGYILSRIFGHAYVPWGGSGKDTHPPSLYRYYIEQGWVPVGLWVPAGNAETETADPYTSPLLNPPTNAQHMPSFGVLDDVGFASLLYNRTWLATEGGTDAWLEYRIDGGAWVPAINDWADDVVNAEDNNAPLVFARYKSGVVSFLVQNPMANDCSAHTVEMKFSGQIYEIKISGRQPFLYKTTY